MEGYSIEENISEPPDAPGGASLVVHRSSFWIPDVAASAFERIFPLGGRDGLPWGFPSNNRLESVGAAQNFCEAKCRQGRPFLAEGSPSADAG